MDEKYMKLAMELAKKGEGKVNPNPLVGAVIVKDKEVIGKGYHKIFGGNHAEVEAFNSLDNESYGATMYVTLEPCSHYGKTPPCVDKIIENKISKVIIGCLDPNPIVKGNGLKKLKSAGIEVEISKLEYKCKSLNEVFMKYISSKKPFVVLKTAMSLDGKISTYTGESKWITGENSRKSVHKLRNKYMGIMVGVNTVIKDNPELTCRLESGNNPVRIIVDSTLRIPMNSKVILNNKNLYDLNILKKINGELENSRDYFRVDNNLSFNNKKSLKDITIIATTNKADKEKIKLLESKGILVIITKQKNNKVDLNDLMIKLGRLNIDSILLEGGAELNFSAINEKIVDKVICYIAPKIIGGTLAKTPIGGQGIEKLIDAINIKNMSLKSIGEDVVIEGYIEG